VFHARWEAEQGFPRRSETGSSGRTPRRSLSKPHFWLLGERAAAVISHELREREGDGDGDGDGERERMGTVSACTITLPSPSCTR